MMPSEAKASIMPPLVANRDLLVVSLQLKKPGTRWGRLRAIRQFDRVAAPLVNLATILTVLATSLVPKNGTLLLDYTLTLMGQGLSARDAVIAAGKTRLNQSL
ncbi:hypothetical protein MAMMFC1_03258 [Methylomusa anaerophila]|uniref:Uncharacterized protein n=2 Tax=Methylomusa anaerophila TaxID=1930071 RepID=A0A348ANB5_9FIRM|nr:hypothetical protein MAMMFC1_03258 [Methylomusa anaerophila]